MSIKHFHTTSISTYIGASIRLDFQASAKTTSDPPISIVPLIATANNAPNIANV